MSEPTRCATDIEVRYAETDQMGVVHHANYVVWFELARTRLCALSGYHYADIEKTGYLLMVTGVEVRYRRPARYGDTVRVVCWGERLAMGDPDFGWTAEMQVKALRHGLRVTEVPVSYRRRVGVSKITGTVVGTLRAGYKILWTVLRHSRG